MKPSEQDRLLREILAGGDVDAFRDASLARGLAFIQRRKRRERVMRVCAVAMLPVLIAAGILVHRHAARFPRVALAVTEKPQPSAPQIQTITDEQLFALFPNRAMALIGSPGHQKLVFLDKGPATDEP